MSRYKPYPQYNDSGVKWFGVIPEKWTHVPLKYISFIKTGFAFNSLDFSSVGIPVLRIGDIKNDGEIDFSNAKYISSKFLETNEDVIVLKNDIVMAMTGATIGKVGLYKIDQPSLLNQRVCIFRSKEKFIQSYLLYILKSSFYLEYISLYAFGGAQPNISDSTLLACCVPLPSLLEQQSIANFLDNATCKIDTLIQKQQNLISLLKEKRQALISHTVTKGLNPHVKMKDSGVEWLGEIPEHWGVVQSRRLFKDRKEKARNDDEQLTASQKHGVIYQKEFMELEGRKVTLVLTGSEILKHVEAGDFVISMRSFQGGLELCKYSGSVSSAYIGLIPIKHVIHDYFKYLFKSITYIQALQSTSNLVRDGQALRFENFSQVDLVIVPEIEQQQIANYLDNATCKIDTLISKAEKAIELLKERRTALISAVVTGKIDVRECAGYKSNCSEIPNSSNQR